MQRGKGKEAATKGKAAAKDVDWESDDDDLEGLKAEDGFSGDDGDDLSDSEAQGLAKARSCALLQSLHCAR